MSDFLLLVGFLWVCVAPTDNVGLALMIVAVYVFCGKQKESTNG